MDPSFVLAVLAAGFGAGFVLTAVGAGSLVSFPILIGAGQPAGDESDVVADVRDER